MAAAELIDAGFRDSDLSLAPEGVALFAIGDVHGRAAAFRAALDHIAATPTPGLRRILVQTGDVIDRGEDNPGAMRLALRAGEIAAVDELVLLPGNHELIFFDALDAPLRQSNFDLWAHNGGAALIADLEAARGPSPAKVIDKADWLAEALAADADLAAWHEALRRAPSGFVSGRVVFVHGGVDPRRGVEASLAAPREGHRQDPRHWAWIRRPFHVWREGWGGRAIVHGHTPAFRPPPSRHRDAAGIEARMDRLASHARLNLDAGAATRPHVGGAQIEAGRRRLFIAQA